MSDLNNPFYDNHIFKKEDIKRMTFSKWNWLWLWLYPTYVQIAIDEGIACHYKIINGAYWLIKMEDMRTEHTWKYYI